MTTEEKLMKLVERLLAKTKASEIQWEATLIRSDQFQTAFPDYTVKVWSRENENDRNATDYVVSVVNEYGTVLESASDVDLSVAFPQRDALLKMEQLYKLARRAALG